MVSRGMRFIGWCVAFLPLSCLMAADYHLSPTGDDGNSGESPETAWQTIGRVNAIDLKPGDRVLFAGGATFTGCLALNKDDAGTKDKPVVISSYGTGRATLANPEGSALKVSVCSFLNISRLIVQGPGYTVLNRSTGFELVWLSDSTIDQVEASGFHKSGFYLNKCDRVRLTNAYAHDNGYAGIHTEGGCSDLYIADCRAINNPGDRSIPDNHSGSGIFVSFTRDSLVEYCEAAENGWDMPCPTMGPFGIWTAFAERITIQHCISHNNKSKPGAWDGGGFDLDGNTNHSILQYNYSYDNHGAGYLLCTFEGSRNTDNVIRYNISENDGYGSHHAGIFAVGSARQSNTRIYHNTVYNSAGRNALAGDGQVPASLVFANNLLVISGTGAFVKDLGKSVLRGNSYWNADSPPTWEKGLAIDAWRAATGNEMEGKTRLGIFADPLLADPGAGEKPTDPRLLRTLIAYRLVTGSPCIGAAVDIRVLERNDRSDRDFFGGRIGGLSARTIGAHEPLALTAFPESSALPSSP